MIAILIGLYLLVGVAAAALAAARWDADHDDKFDMFDVVCFVLFWPYIASLLLLLFCLDRLACWLAKKE